MDIKRVWAVYFSPVGGTENAVLTAASAAAAELGLTVKRIDFTLPAARKETTNFESGDLVFFATPTYAGKTPNKLLPWLQSGFAGNGALAAAVVTFGNRSYDNSLAELCAVLEADGFHTIAGAAFAVRHVFSDTLGAGRPDDEDAALMADFGRRCGEKAAGLVEIPAPAAVSQGRGWSARQIPACQAQDRHGQVRGLRYLCRRLPGGVHQPGQCGGGARYLHQVPCLRAPLSHGRQVF